METGGDVYARLSPLSLLWGWSHVRLTSSQWQTRSHEDHLVFASIFQSLPRQWCGRSSGEPDALHDRSSYMDQDTEKLERHMQQTDMVQAWAMPHTNKRWASRSVTSAWASIVPGVLHQPSEHKTWLLLYFHFPKCEKNFSCDQP